MYRIGVDVGGTFTDIIVVDSGGRITPTKVLSTPRDPSIGVLEGLARAATGFGLELRAFFAATDLLVHGTTVATNALLESKGARLGMLTTAGHRDVLEMREGYKDDRYNLRMSAPDPLVPRRLRLGVKERVAADGSIDTPMDVASLEKAAQELAAANVDAVAICFLHSYRSPQHELRAEAVVRNYLPNAYVSASSQVLPQIREFERFSTTAVNGYIGPVLSRYLNQLRGRLDVAGYAGPVLIIQSHGGISPLPETMRLAAGSVLSGPAGGVSGGRLSAKILDQPNLITFDMGGTSTDIAMIVDGECQLTFDRAVGGHKIALPSLDILTLGAGGGSIAQVGASGILRVGPHSAGADPGPACYGRGGTMATVTDANLLLGFLDADRFAGGDMTLDRAAAEAAVARVAQDLSIDTVAAAQGIFTVVNTAMAEGIRLVSVKRGFDPRRFALLSFGGAAGLHITEIARRLEIRRVVVPRVAALLSAWGMLNTDLRYEVVRSRIGDMRQIPVAELRAILNGIEADGRARLGDMFAGKIRAEASLDLRYGEQVHTINVSLAGLDLDDPDFMANAAERFHARHKSLYTFNQPTEPVVLINARVAVVGELDALPPEEVLVTAQPTGAAGARRVYLDGWRMIPVFNLDELAGSQTVEGPAIIEAPTTTVLLRKSEHASLTPQRWLDIRLPSQ